MRSKPSEFMIIWIHLDTTIYSYDESITVYKLGHLFPNYNVLIGNFDNYCSNLIVSDD